MLNAFNRGCEMHISMNRTLKDKPSAAAQYRVALAEARSSDSAIVHGPVRGGHLRRLPPAAPRPGADRQPRPKGGRRWPGERRTGRTRTIEVVIGDFGGWEPNADPHDVEPGVSIRQVNAMSWKPGELRVRPGFRVVQFDTK
jgi:hypothetical protein